MTKPKPPHVLIFNNGAMFLFSSIACAGGLLTDPRDIVNVGMLLEDSFATLPSDKLDTRDGMAQHEVTRIAHAWQRKGAHQIPCTEGQREAAKKMVRGAVEKGLVNNGPASLCILRQLGLADGV